jgi:proteasome assembly chaperone (PAC2) family protein
MNKAAQTFEQLRANAQQETTGSSLSTLAGIGALGLAVGVAASKGKKGIADMGTRLGMKIKNMAVAKNTIKATEAAPKITSDIKKVNKKVVKTYTDNTGKVEAIQKAMKENAKRQADIAKKRTPKVKALKKKTTTGKIDKNVENYDIA